MFVPEARPLRAALLRKQTEGAEEWRTLYEAEIDALRDQLKEAEESESTAVDLAESLEKERNYYREENARLRACNENLRASLDARANGTTTAEERLPENYEDLAHWAGEQFVGRLELHPRAIRALKQAKYEDIGLVCRGLALLAREYRNMRMGWDGAKEAWEQGLRETGLDFSGSISESRAGQEGEAYFIDYPPHSRQRRLLEFHLRRGTSREQQRCLRIYFLWDEDTQQVVVGWLPSHLDTRLT
jgi:hypothetical protein